MISSEFFFLAPVSTLDLERTELEPPISVSAPTQCSRPPELLPGLLPVQNLALQRLRAGQTLSRAAANTPPEERSLQAGEPGTTMLGFLHFMLSYSLLSASFHSPASKKASKGRVTLPQPLFGKHGSLSTSALPLWVFPPLNSQSSPSEPERHPCLSSHTASVNTRCLDGSRPSSPSTWWISIPCSPAV